MHTGCTARGVTIENICGFRKMRSMTMCVPALAEWLTTHKILVTGYSGLRFSTQCLRFFAPIRQNFYSPHYYQVTLHLLLIPTFFLRLAHHSFERKWFDARCVRYDHNYTVTLNLTLTIGQPHPINQWLASVGLSRTQQGGSTMFSNNVVSSAEIPKRSGYLGSGACSNIEKNVNPIQLLKSD